jgi:hypothetical protein
MHTTPRVQQWLAENPHVAFYSTPVGSLWLKQSIRRGTFTSVKALVTQIRDYIDHWNVDARPFTWTATTDEILAKVAFTQTNVNKFVANNAK